MKPGSHLHAWDYVAVAVYFIAVLAIGFYSMFRANRGTISGYFLAGRYMVWVTVGASLFASNIGSEHFIGLAGSGAAAGIAVGAFELNACLILQLLSWVFLPVYIASAVCTLPEYMQKRFGGRRIQVYLAVISLLLYIFTKITVNLYAGALFIQQALNWNLYLSVLLLLAVTALITVTGGLAAVMYTETLQAFIMVVGGLVLMAISFVKVGGYQALHAKYMVAVPNSTLQDPNATCGYPRADSWYLLRDPVKSDLPWPGFLLGQTTVSIWYWCTDQMMVQRALASKNLSHAQGGTLLAGYLKLLPIFLMVLPGMVARVLFPDELACASAEACWEICQNRAGCSNIAYPKLVLELMPTGMKGVMMAVMLAALMSDLTSIFNSASTLFTMDIYRYCRKRCSVKELMIVGRLCVVVLVALSTLWIPVVEKLQGGQLFYYIQAVSAYLAPPIAAVYCLAILWKRGNELGAFSGLLVGFVVGVIRMILDFCFPEPACWETDDRPAVLANLHFMYFALLLFVLTSIVMVVVSLLTAPPTEQQLNRTTFWSRLDPPMKALEEDSDLSAAMDDHTNVLALTDSPSAEIKEQPSSTERPDGEAASAGLRDTGGKENYGTLSEVDEPTGETNGTSAGSGTTKLHAVHSSQPHSRWRSAVDWFCGFEAVEDSIVHTHQMAQHLEEIATLKQEPWAKKLLLTAFVGLLIINLFLYVFFCTGSNFGR